MKEYRNEYKYCCRDVGLESSKNSSAERTIYFDLLRIFAASAVMLIHISAQYWYDTDVHTYEWNVFNFSNCIVQWGVPIFTMISGALFLNGTQTTKVIYKKYIFRIMISFSFWSAIYVLFDYARGLGLKRVISNFLRGHYHMWYLFMIAGLYMIVPFLRRIAENDRLAKYFLALGLVFDFIIPQASQVISFFPEKSSIFFQEIVGSINGSITMRFVQGFSFYFVLGNYIHGRKISPKYFRGICIIGAIGFLSTIILSTAVSRYTGTPYGGFQESFTLNILFESIFVFVFFKKKFEGGGQNNLVTGRRKLFFCYPNIALGHI